MRTLAIFTLSLSLTSCSRYSDPIAGTWSGTVSQIPDFPKLTLVIKRDKESISGQSTWFQSIDFSAVNGFMIQRWKGNDRIPEFVDMIKPEFDGSTLTFGVHDGTTRFKFVKLSDREGELDLSSASFVTGAIPEVTEIVKPLRVVGGSNLVELRLSGRGFSVSGMSVTVEGLKATLQRRK